jgi:hypothetical protein
MMQVGEHEWLIYRARLPAWRALRPRACEPACHPPFSDASTTNEPSRTTTYVLRSAASRRLRTPFAHQQLPSRHKGAGTAGPARAKHDLRMVLKSLLVNTSPTYSMTNWSLFNGADTRRPSPQCAVVNRSTDALFCC